MFKLQIIVYLWIINMIILNYFRFKIIQKEGVFNFKKFKFEKKVSFKKLIYAYKKNTIIDIKLKKMIKNYYHLRLILALC